MIEKRNTSTFKIQHRASSTPRLDTHRRRGPIRTSITMCVTNIYIDRYPDGREVVYRYLSTCQYGLPGRPCPTHSTVENPVRKIQYGEPSTQHMFNHPIFPSSPPQSSTSSQHRYSGGSQRRHSRSLSHSDDGRHHLKRNSLKPTRQHRKERIIEVDAPPTPTTPPQLFAESFTAPSSPDPRGRPIIVDERPLYRVASPSLRQRSSSRPPFGWDTPSTSHTSFDLRAEREREERAKREQERTQRQREAQLEEEVRRARLIAEANENINRRTAVPIAPLPLRQRSYLRPVVDQTEALQERFGAMTLNGRGNIVGVNAADEAMRQRLRERQMPKRRFTVGPGHRRHRVLYDDGVYRWE